MAKTNLPMLEQRRIEANIIRPIYDEMASRLGEDKAAEILSAAIINDSIAHGKAYARDEARDTDLEGFHKLLPQWKANGALEVEMLKETENEVHYNVTRCKYAEMYHEMGIGKIGSMLSCARDGTFCQGYNPAIKLERTQTIMQGASHCDFRYSFSDEG